MKRFVLTPRAKQDLNKIWDYIADDNIEAADRVLNVLVGCNHDRDQSTPAEFQGNR